MRCVAFLSCSVFGWALVAASPAGAQATPTVDECVQVRVETLELQHLKQINQIKPEEFEKKSKALWERQRQIDQMFGGLAQDQARALNQQIDNRAALVLPPLQEKWGQEEQRFNEEQRAL